MTLILRESIVRRGNESRAANYIVPLQNKVAVVTHVRNRNPKTPQVLSAGTQNGGPFVSSEARLITVTKSPDVARAKFAQEKVCSYSGQVQRRYASHEESQNKPDKDSWDRIPNYRHPSSYICKDYCRSTRVRNNTIRRRPPGACSVLCEAKGRVASSGTNAGTGD
jgi:hypothetical protein